jgi:hypothetical protein
MKGRTDSKDEGRGDGKEEVKSAQPVSSAVAAINPKYEQILSGQVSASEISTDPNALKSVIAFVAGNFKAEGTSKEPESMPPEVCGL